MDRKTIDRIVWWIPFKQLRNDIREYLTLIYRLEINSMRSRGSVYAINPKLDTNNAEALYYGVPRIDIKKNIFFYLPNCLDDFISSEIIYNANFYEVEVLKFLNKYIPSNAIILDIGANIGNHSLYWASVRKAKKIIAFEPVKQTYDILEKNVSLNSLANIITTLNIGLGNKKENASVAHFFYDNIGGTHINYNENGDMKVDLLDNIELNTDKVNFIKIDVEGFEINVLNGAKKTILKHKPIIFIESISSNFENVKDILKELGYIKYLGVDDCKYFGINNHLFLP